MKKILFVFLLFFISSFIFGQQYKLDSLWSVYKDSGKSDGIRIEAINYIAFQLSTPQPDSAIFLAEQTRLYAVKINNKIYESKSYNIKGMAYYTLENYSLSETNYKQALKIREETDDKIGIGYCYINLTKVYVKKEDYKNALDCLSKAIEIFKVFFSKKDIRSLRREVEAIKLKVDSAKSRQDFYNGWNPANYPFNNGPINCLASSENNILVGNNFGIFITRNYGEL